MIFKFLSRICQWLVSSRQPAFLILRVLNPRVSTEIEFCVKITKTLSSLRGTVWVCTEQDSEWIWRLCSGSALPHGGAVCLLQESEGTLWTSANRSPELTWRWWHSRKNLPSQLLRRLKDFQLSFLHKYSAFSGPGWTSFGDPIAPVLPVAPSAPSFT